MKNKLKKQAARIQGVKCVLNLNYMRKRTAYKIRRMVNLPFQKLEVAGSFKTAVINRRFVLCTKSEAERVVQDTECH